MTTLRLNETTAAERFVEFVNKCPSQFHATAEVANILAANGFARISERKPEDWNLRPNGKYFFTRNQSSIVAFSIGGNWKPGNGFIIIGAHTDSPVLKLKPVTKIEKAECLLLGVECYGGGLWNTWWDRDLSVAGRVMVDEGNGVIRSRLVQIKDPIVRIPNLAIHLNRTVSSDGFKFNNETELVPILATQLQAKAIAVKTGFGKTCCCGEKKTQEAAPATQASSSSSKSDDAWVNVAVKGAASGAPSTPTALSSTELGLTTPDFADRHHAPFLALIASALGIQVSQIRDFELSLYDTQPAQITGLYKEFISSRALDNLMMSYCATESLVRASLPATLASATQVFMIALFDNEEVGSSSMMGAGSNLMRQILGKVNGDEKTYDAAIAKSILISADMAHAWHPNYTDKHEQNHRPLLHKGLVVKYNGNLRYATSNASTAAVMEIARAYNIPIQQFCVRNDSPCGSTIGPILASSCGIRTVDVGIPQWAMHSIRETCGTADVESTTELFTHLFPEFAAVDAKVIIDE